MLRTEQKITPLLWFAGEAEEAINFYVSIFADSKITKISRYEEGGPGPEGDAMMIEFKLEGQEFMALNGSSATDAALGDAPPRGGIALFLTCPTQAEVDRVWDALADGGQVMQCGWLRDRYGFAWNIVPEGWGDYMGHDDPVKRKRAMDAMLQMVKLDINALRRAVEGESGA